MASGHRLHSCEVSTPAEADVARGPMPSTSPTLSDPELGGGGVVAAATAPTFERSLGRYQIVRELGRGGMGVVLEAYDPVLDRRVALKILSRELQTRQAQRQLREAQALARLSHPNVVAVYEVGVYEEGLAEGRSFIAMELVEGQSLREWHREPRPWPELLDAYLQAGRGLAAAHGEGLVHRDFKPSNCLIDATGRVRVADFGLAGDVEELRRSSSGDEQAEPSAAPRSRRSAPPSPDPQMAVQVDAQAGAQARSQVEAARGSPFARITREGAVLGTLAYMSPEQRLGAPWDARGDQYSFCVSLCEALLGEQVLRSSLGPLDASATRGRPGTRRIPRALRRVLARGLAPDPAQRWPSMLELLGALERCRRGGGRRRWALALLGTNVAIGALLWANRGTTEPPCRQAREHLRGVWDEHRARAVDEALLATALPYADDARAAVRTRLDRYADDWVDLHTLSCEAAHVHGELSPAALDQRMACLQGRRSALGHAVDQLVEADAEVVEQAVRVVAGLPSLPHCGDAQALQGDPRPPPEQVDEVAALRVELDRARTRLAAGKYDAGLQEAEAAVASAQALGFAPVDAEARLIRGRIYQAMGRYEEAAADLRVAHAIALRTDHAEVAAEAAASLTFVEGVPLAQAHTAGLLGESALALAQRVDADGPREAEALLGWAQALAKHGDDAEAEGHFVRALALLGASPQADPLDVVGALDGLRGVLRRQGRHAEAERHARDALTLVEQQLGPEHPAMVHRLANLAAVLVDQGHHVAAEQELRRALEVGGRSLAPDHPALAHVHSNLGAALLYRGRHEEATAELDRALEIWQRALSPAHDLVADVLVNLGVAARGRGRPDEAERHYRRALAQYAEVYEGHHPKVAMVELNLGKALQAQGREDEAAERLERARAAFERYGGPEHPDVGKALDALGLLEYQRGRYPEAHAWQRQALAILERAYPADHPRVARGLWALGRTELALGELDQARARLERALEVQRGAEVRAVDRAQTERTLAELQWRGPATAREEARALAGQALARLRDEPGDAAARLRGELEAWLAAHR